MAFTSGDAQFGARFLQLAGNSFTLSAVTALAAVMIALLLAYVARTSRRRLPNWINRIAGLGYAFPGSVIAVGVLIPLTRVDIWLARSEEHPSELQSLMRISYAVFCLKKKNKNSY